MSPTVTTLPPLDASVPPDFHQLVRLAQIQHFALKGSLTYQENCFIASISVILAAAELGIPALFQAGSLQWRFMDPSLDDGVSATHYANMWEPTHPRSARLYHEMIQALLTAERDPSFCLPPGNSPLPEVHCWVVLPQRPLVVDLTSGTFPDSATKLGFTWSAPHPPKYYFGWPDGDTCRYMPDQQATQLLFALANLHLRSAGPEVVKRFSSHVLTTAKSLCQTAA